MPQKTERHGSLGLLIMGPIDDIRITTSSVDETHGRAFVRSSGDSTTKRERLAPRWSRPRPLGCLRQERTPARTADGFRDEAPR
jgi:hypothetical protein